MTSQGKSTDAALTQLLGRVFESLVLREDLTAQSLEPAAVLHHTLDGGTAELF